MPDLNWNFGQASRYTEICREHFSSRPSPSGQYSRIDDSYMCYRKIWTKIRKTDRHEHKSSMLVVEHADVLDTGKFTCQVSDRSHQQCQSVALTVLPLPEVIMKPSVTVKPVSHPWSPLARASSMHLSCTPLIPCVLISAGRQRDHYVLPEKRIHQVRQHVAERRHATGENGQERLLGRLASWRQRAVREEHNGKSNRLVRRFIFIFFKFFRPFVFLPVIFWPANESDIKEIPKVFKNKDLNLHQVFVKSKQNRPNGLKYNSFLFETFRVNMYKRRVRPKDFEWVPRIVSKIVSRDCVYRIIKTIFSDTKHFIYTRFPMPVYSYFLNFSVNIGNVVCFCK